MILSKHCRSTASAQECSVSKPRLRVPGDLNAVAGGCELVEEVADAGCGADRNGRLHRDDGRTLDTGCELADGGEQVGEVIGVLAGLLQGADADEVQVGEDGGLRVGGGELQPARRGMAGEHVVEVAFVEGRLAGVEDRDLVHVTVHAEDLVAEFGHAGRVGGTEVAAADDGELHELVPFRGGGRRRPPPLPRPDRAGCSGGPGGQVAVDPVPDPGCARGGPPQQHCAGRSPQDNGHGEGGHAEQRKQVEDPGGPHRHRVPGPPPDCPPRLWPGLCLYGPDQPIRAGSDAERGDGVGAPLLCVTADHRHARPGQSGQQPGPAPARRRAVAATRPAAAPAASTEGSRSTTALGPNHANSV
uniref:Uncharacterized protein n=1 Tax=Streptomyces sp. F12 TaxID=1436084 RepID=V9Z7Z5_9ACTN|nr:hypothetical protein pFRL6_151 [Streptomyces sp. F12]